MNAAVLLRQKVLDLAIRGKLTKREKGDEPASALLARIVAEKEKRNAKVGRARTSAVPDPISEDEIPFELPNGWVWCRMGSLVEIISGVSYQKSDIRPEGIRILRGGNLKEDNHLYLNDDDVFISRSYANGENTVRKDDIVVVASTGSATVIGRPAIAEADMPGVQIGAFLRIVRAHEVELAKWLQLIFRANFYRNHIRESSKGTNINNLKNEYITEFCIPLPPLAEQKRIVERIDELLAAIDQYSAAMGKISNAANLMVGKVLDLAIRGKLTRREKGDDSALEILEKIAVDKAKRVAKKLTRKEKTLPPIEPDDEPFDLPKGWVWCRFGELCAYGQCEAVSFSGLPKNTWALDLEEIEKDTGRLIERKLVKDKQATSGKHLFKKGMLLYSKLRTYLNKVLIADQDGVCTSEIIPIDFHGFVDVAYARIVLMSPYFLSYTASKDYGVKMPRVSTDDMRMAAFPLPPLAEQKRIVERVDAILAECRKVSR